MKKRPKVASVEKEIWSKKNFGRKRISAKIIDQKEAQPKKNLAEKIFGVTEFGTERDLTEKKIKIGC